MCLIPHRIPIFYANRRPDDVELDLTSFLCLILPPQQFSTPNNTKLRPKPFFYCISLMLRESLKMRGEIISIFLKRGSWVLEGSRVKISPP